MIGPATEFVKQQIAALQKAGKLPVTLTLRQETLLARSLARYSDQVAQKTLDTFLEDFKTKLTEANALKEAEDIRPMLADLGRYVESEEARDHLEWSLGVSQEVAAGAGRYANHNLDPEAVNEWPAWELMRMFDRDVPRGFRRGPKGTLIPVPNDDWPARWEAAGGTLLPGGRMVALKSSPIWQSLGDGEGGYDDTLGNPFPPFAFNSGFMTVEIDRAEAEALGLIAPGQRAQPAPVDFGDLLEMEEEDADGIENRVINTFDPDQPRDELGRWTDSAHERYSRITADSETDVHDVRKLFVGEGIERDFAKAMKGRKVKVVSTPSMNPQALGSYGDSDRVIALKKGLSKDEFNYAIRHELAHAIDHDTAGSVGGEAEARADKIMVGLGYLPQAEFLKRRNP